MFAPGLDAPRAGRMTLIDLWRFESMARWSWAVKEEQRLQTRVIAAEEPVLAKAHSHDEAEVPTEP